MNKILMVFIGLFILAVSFVLVSALDGKMTGGNDSVYIVEVDVVRGWNIIAGIIPNEAITPDSEIKSSDIKVVWYYAPTLNKYVQIHPEVDMSAQIDDDVALTSAMWVYSEKAGRLKYSTLEDYMPLDLRELSTGWNFVTITPDMYHGTLDGAGYEDEYFSWNSIKGTCNIEKVFYWMYPTQEWNQFSSFETTKIEEYDFDDFLGNGMVVKVTTDCHLQIPSEITNPPSIPGDACTDSDGGLNYYVKGTTIGQNEDGPPGITSASDSCNGNNLYEFICKPSGEFDDESYTCPNGCQNGACTQ